MQYSPKLKMAMEDIKQILAKYDIAAAVALHTPGHGEFLLHLSPTYSCARFQGDQLNIRAKLVEDFNGNKEAWTLKVTNTSNMLSSMCDSMDHNCKMLKVISKILDERVQADHDNRGNTSHTTQNN